MEELVNDLIKLRNFLKEMIIDTLKLEDIAVEDIDDDAPLFKDGLGLDSIDALELVVAIEKHFNIIIEDENKAIPEFVAFIMTSLKEKMEAMATGGTFKELSKTNFEKLIQDISLLNLDSLKMF